MPIFDQGYQHWQGKLSNQRVRWMAIAMQGVRIGMQNRVVRNMVLLAWIPAIMLVGIISLWGLVEQKAGWAMRILAIFAPPEFMASPASFRVTMWTYCFHYFLNTEICFVVVLMLLIGPALISQDLRFNALPLYFSRPVRRIDYFLGKLGIIGAFLGMVAVVPAVAAWLLGVLFSLDFRVIADTWHILVGVLVYGAVVTLSAGLLVLALSSLTRNSRYVAVFCAGFWLLGYSVYGILEMINTESVHRRMNEQYQREWQAQQKMAQEERDRQQQEQMDWQRENDPRTPKEEREKLRREREARQLARMRQPRQEQPQNRFSRERRQFFAEVFRNDWRGCFSYMSNLLRIGDALLDFDRAQDRFDALMESARQIQLKNNRMMAQVEEEFVVDDEPNWPRWPWWWSAMILLALGGLCAWILNTRVKTLDRLR